MSQQLSDSLNRAIETAWVEVNQDPHHRLRIQTRLHLYDELIADMEVPISQLIKNGHKRFPSRAPGLRRHSHLGIITVKPLFPAWESEMDRLVSIEPDNEPIRLFPYSMLSATHQLLSGKTISEIVINNEYWNGITDWHYIVGNISEDLFHQHAMFLDAVYRVYTVIAGWLPFSLIHSELTESTYDEDLKTPEMENRDFTYHALQANISEDPNEPGWDKPRSLPIKRDKEKALAFWQWWLFKAVPQAATADLDQLYGTG